MKTDILGRPRGQKPDIGPMEFDAEDTRPLKERFLELLKKRQAEIIASCQHREPGDRAPSP